VPINEPPLHAALACEQQARKEVVYATCGLARDLCGAMQLRVER